MSSPDRTNPNDERDKNKASESILEMLREAGVSTESLEEKRHAFWDTQVSVLSMATSFVRFENVFGYRSKLCLATSL